MKIITNYFTAFFIVSFVFCSCVDSVNNKLIVGKWKAVEWLESGTPNATKSQDTYFNFDANNTYSLGHGVTIKKGTYKVENNLLFTTEEGMQEIMVNITKLTADSLVFDMNNGGAPEQLTLMKVK